MDALGSNSLSKLTHLFFRICFEFFWSSFESNLSQFWVLAELLFGYFSVLTKFSFSYGSIQAQFCMQNLTKYKKSSFGRFLPFFLSVLAQFWHCFGSVFVKSYSMVRKTKSFTMFWAEKCQLSPSIIMKSALWKKDPALTDWLQLNRNFLDMKRRKKIS